MKSEFSNKRYNVDIDLESGQIVCPSCVPGLRPPKVGAPLEKMLEPSQKTPPSHV